MYFYKSSIISICDTSHKYCFLGSWSNLTFSTNIIVQFFWKYSLYSRWKNYFPSLNKYNRVLWTGIISSSWHSIRWNQISCSFIIGIIISSENLPLLVCIVAMDQKQSKQFALVKVYFYRYFFRKQGYINRFSCNITYYN